MSPAASPAVVTILIEDAVPFSQALAAYFRSQNCGVDCVACFPSAEAALAGVGATGAAVALVDIHLPGMDGIECVARLRALQPQITCLILTVFEDAAVIFEALKAGACGYLLKRMPPEAIAEAVRQAHAGGSPMSPQIARQVVTFFHQRAQGGMPELTVREREVLDLLATGSLYKEIAVRLGVTIDTVRTHLRHIYDKLQVHTRTEAVVKYLQRRP